MKAFQKLTDLIHPPKEYTSVCFFPFFLIQEARLFPGVVEFMGSEDNRLLQTDASFFISLDMNSPAVV